MYKPSPPIIIDIKESFQFHDIYKNDQFETRKGIFLWNLLPCRDSIYRPFKEKEKKKKAFNSMFIKMIVRKDKGIFFWILLHKKYRLLVIP